MREALIALLVCLVLVGVGLALRVASALQLLYAGGVLVVGGLGFSLPIAFWYHWKLYWTLKPRGDLSRNWIWVPVQQHAKLRPEERSMVLPWFYAGAAGWVVSVLGLVLLGLAYWVELRR